LHLVKPLEETHVLKKDFNANQKNDNFQNRSKNLNICSFDNLNFNPLSKNTKDILDNLKSISNSR